MPPGVPFGQTALRAARPGAFADPGCVGDPPATATCWPPSTGPSCVSRRSTRTVRREPSRTRTGTCPGSRTGTDPGGRPRPTDDGGVRVDAVVGPFPNRQPDKRAKLRLVLRPAKAPCWEQMRQPHSVMRPKGVPPRPAPYRFRPEPGLVGDQASAASASSSALARSVTWASTRPATARSSAGIPPQMRAETGAASAPTAAISSRPASVGRR